MIEDFKYLAPKTVDEALRLLDQYKDECRIIAGGQSLLILMRQGLLTPKYLIDIQGVRDLDYICRTEDGLKIGALTTHRILETSLETNESFAVLREMEKSVSSVETRNRGTIGGNLCHADPGGDPCPVLIALNSTVILSSTRGQRTLALEEFPTGYLETCIMPDELLTEIQVPNPPLRTGTAYKPFNLLHGDYAIASVAASITLEADLETCCGARIVLGSVAPTAMRSVKAEAALEGRKLDQDEIIHEASEYASEEADPVSDIHATATYRKELVKVMASRAINEAVRRAKQGKSLCSEEAI